MPFFSVFRVIEPELMTGADQVRAYAEADFTLGDSQVIERVEELIQIHRKLINEKSLLIDLGCGPGNITERLASKWPNASVIGIDGSSEMLSLAIARNLDSEKKQKFAKLSYNCLNISSIERNGINRIQKPADVVVSNSLLHHIHEPILFWNALKKISAKGTLFFHRDLRRPASLKEVYTLQERYLPTAPSILINDYVASLRAAFTVPEIVNQLKEADIDYLNVSEVNDRYIDVVGILQ